MINTKLDEIEASHLNQMRDIAYQISVNNGFYKNPKEVGTEIALMHSELSEALEGDRKNLMDRHLPHRKSIEVELADCVLRIFSFCGHKGYDIGGAIVEKNNYNISREDHKPENRELEHGKKY